MQAQYVRLECVCSASTWLVSIEVAQRSAIELPRHANGIEEVCGALASQLLWRDFGHFGDWQDPAASTSISSKQGWKVSLYQTILGEDVQMLVRSHRRSDAFLPNNLFGASLVRDRQRALGDSINGRVLLVRAKSDPSAETCCDFTLESYSAEDFAADLKFIERELLTNVSITFPENIGEAPHPRFVPAPSLLVAPVMITDATYVRLSCRRSTNAQRWLLEVDTHRRSVPLSIDGPKSSPSNHFREIRQQLSRKLLWQDFGHDSDWKVPGSSAPICTKWGWEVGLLETTLGDNIWMLARKPCGGEEACLPFNHFATTILHQRHRPLIRFVNGTVLFVRAEQDLVDTRIPPGATYSLQSLNMKDFQNAYNALPSDVLENLTLLTPDAEEPTMQHNEGAKEPLELSVLSCGVDSANTSGVLINTSLQGQSAEADTTQQSHGTSVTVEASDISDIASSASNPDLDEWEMVVQAEVI